MKLDRNTNRGGRGKYALVNMRKLIPLLDKEPPVGGSVASIEAATVSAFELLVAQGIITLGNESPGEQFFVMKYKDKFTAKALFAYADAVRTHADRLREFNPENPQSDSLDEYAAQMKSEAINALQLGNRIPD